MKPILSGVTPVLQVLDMAQSIEFYTTRLGFAVAWQATDEGLGMCMLQIGKVSLLLSGMREHGSVPSFTGSLYFDCPNVESLWQSLRETVDVVWPLEKMEYGQTEFGIKDGNGYILAFARGEES